MALKDASIRRALRERGVRARTGRGGVKIASWRKEDKGALGWGDWGGGGGGVT